jgi:hypothetical protein
MSIINKSRPAALTCLALFFLVMALWNGLRFIEVAIFHGVLDEYKIHWGSLFIGFTGGFWFITGLAIFWGLWYMKTWAWFASLASVIGYGGWYWIDRLVLQIQNDNWSFALTVTVLFVFVPIIVLLTPRIRRSFRKELYERKSKV